MTPFDEIEPSDAPRRLLGVIRRRALLVVMIMAICAGGAYAYSKNQPTEYSSSSSLLFRDSGLDQKLFGASFIAPSRDPRRDAATNERLVISPVVARMTAERLGGSATARDVLAGITVLTQGESNLVTVKATAGTPGGAQSLADTYAQEFIRYRRAADRAKVTDARRLVESQIAEIRRDDAIDRQEQLQILRERSDQLQILSALQTGNVELAQPAGRPSVPSAPRTKRNTVLGAFLGLVFGLVIAFVLEALDRRIRTADEVEAIYRSPLLSVLPHSGNLETGEASLSGPDAEMFRLLRARLRYFNVDRELHTLLVTSEAPAEGKSTVSWHLASVAAEMGSERDRVLLLEADLRRPTVAERLGQPVTAGLADVLTHRASVEDTILRVPVGASTRADGNGGAPRRELHVMTAGAVPPNPAELCDSVRMRELLAELRRHYALVVIDAPPATIVSDTISLIPSVDGLILVSRIGVATRDGAKTLRQQLEEMDAPLLGVVVNGAGRDAAPYYAYSGYGEYLATGVHADVEQSAKVRS